MPHLFNESGAKRIVAAVRHVEREQKRNVPRRYDGVDVTPPVWVEITAEDPANPGLFAWKKMVPANGELTDTAPLIDSGHVDPEDPESDPPYNAMELNGERVYVGRKVLLRFVGYADDAPRYLFGAALAGTHFTVVLEEDGPAVSGDFVGDRANPVRYVYKLTHPGFPEVVLAEQAAPSWRPWGTNTIGNVPTPATRGTAYFDSDGNIVLFHAHEVYAGNSDCAEEEEGSA